jgi:hypothetical protein
MVASRPVQLDQPENAQFSTRDHYGPLHNYHGTHHSHQVLRAVEGAYCQQANAAAGNMLNGKGYCSSSLKAR